MTNRYSTIPVIKNSTGKRFYRNNIYPDIPATDQDIYVITTVGDRLDLLASDYYNDSTLYWIIASANDLPGDSLIPPLGQQLRIPGNVEAIINSYININQNR
jgi:hypothetical protein